MSEASGEPMWLWMISRPLKVPSQSGLSEPGAKGALGMGIEAAERIYMAGLGSYVKSAYLWFPCGICASQTSMVAPILRLRLHATSYTVVQVLEGSAERIAIPEEVIAGRGALV